VYCGLKRSDLERSMSKTKKPAAGGGAAGFSKRTEQQLGGGVLLFHQTPLGGGVGRLKPEALREEVHRFVGFEDSGFLRPENRLCCTAAMQEMQPSSFHRKTGTFAAIKAPKRKNARVIRGRWPVRNARKCCNQRATAARATLRMSAR
jgi:hypothetical protein